MKKDIQKAINEEVISVYKVMNDEYNNSYPHKWIKLRSCSAHVTETNNFYILRSYNTIVSCVEKQTGVCYDFLRYVYGYTSTSNQHISKFLHDYTKYPWNKKLTYYSI